MAFYANKLISNWVDYAFSESHKAIDYDESFYIDRFVYLWFAFNASYGEYLDRSQSEFDAIVKAINLGSVNVEHLRVVACFKTLPEMKIKNVRANRFSSKFNLIDNPDSDLWIKGYLRIIYTVRCNLFHGSKNLYSARDIEIIANATETLCWLISEFFKDGCLADCIRKYKDQWDGMAKNILIPVKRNL